MFKSKQQLHTHPMAFEGVRVDFFINDRGEWQNSAMVSYHRRVIPFTIAAAPRLNFDLLRLYRKSEFFKFYGWIRHDHKDGGYTNSIFYSINSLQPW